jgi:hypothetical protein
MAYRPAYSYNVAIALASTNSGRTTPFGVYLVRLAATADCWVTIGPSAVATIAGGMLVRASSVGEPFAIAQGDSIACISTAAGGTLNVTELTQ